jgi:hypothetical protein
MPRGRKRKNKEEETEEEVEEKVAKIGEFATPKEEVPEEIPPEAEEIPEEEVPPEEAPKEETLEEIKEHLMKLILPFATFGLPEAEKENFEKTFRYLNGALFEVLNLGKNLDIAFERIKEKFNLSPEKAFIIYLLGTIGLVIILRPDLREKIFRKKGKPEEQKPPETPPSPKEEKVEQKQESK